MAIGSSGTGKGGKSFQDRELAAKVRTLALETVYEVLQGKGLGKDKQFKKAVLLKLSTTLLPRLNEHSGPNGGPIETNDVSELSENELLNITRTGKRGASKKGVG